MNTRTNIRVTAFYEKYVYLKDRSEDPVLILGDVLHDRDHFSWSTYEPYRKGSFRPTDWTTYRHVPGLWRNGHLASGASNWQIHTKNPRQEIVRAMKDRHVWIDVDLIGVRTTLANLA